MIDLTNPDIMSQVQTDAIPYEAILTPTQYNYYMAYFRGGKMLSDIADAYGVDITTVCRVIKAARRRIIAYYKEWGDRRWPQN